ncbi:MAG: cob(I)yrinic acid a,c-diamide adenosyltransferase [Verrucomicrobiae bacterium]|nr:cob(I)yrinic acid a,c-diamide adenosyltransferase [Verrucomicrobiae bacterium]
MTRIYTRSGDDGTTVLPDGRRVRKDDPEVEALGALDELNSAIGLARSLIRDRGLDRILAEVQNDLFQLEKAPSVEKLERWIDAYEAKLPPLRRFVVPVGPLHFARAVCRRAERVCVKVMPVVYLNRLGDLLFVLARWARRGREQPVSRLRGAGRSAPAKR